MGAYRNINPAQNKILSSLLSLSTNPDAFTDNTINHTKICGGVKKNVEILSNKGRGDVFLIFFIKKYLEKRSAPDKSRTHNLQIRSLALYPIELRALREYIIHTFFRCVK